MSEKWTGERADFLHTLQGLTHGVQRTETREWRILVRCPVFLTDSGSIALAMRTERTHFREGQMPNENYRLDPASDFRM